MDAAIFAYYLLCYSEGIVAVLVAVLAASLRKTVQDRRFAFFIGGMTVMVLSFTVGSHLISTNRLGGAVATTVGLVNVLSDSFLVFSLPFFVHSLVPFPRAALWNRMWAATAVVVSVAASLAMFFHGPPAAFTLLFSAMGGAVAYGTLIGIFHLLRRRGQGAEGAPSQDRRRWTSILTALPVTSAAYLPFFVIFDLFPRGFPSLTGALQPTVKVFPSFYAIINGLYLVKTVPSLVKGRDYRGAPAPENAAAPDLDALNLSPREREVAVLLLEGMTYKEIARRLFVSLATVKTHVDRIYRKTGAANKMELSFMMRGAPAHQNAAPDP